MLFYDFQSSFHKSKSVSSKKYPLKINTRKQKMYCFHVFLKMKKRGACMFDADQNVLYTYTAKNEQLVAILLRTGLNNVLLPTLLIVVNNNVQSVVRKVDKKLQICQQ